MSRNTLAALVVVAALILQVSVAGRLPLPGPVAPDLVLLAVVALALANGSLSGLVTGFLAGLTSDIVPPADHTIGRYAFVYCLLGYLCGLASREMERSEVLPFVAVAAGAVAGSVLYAGLGMLLSDPRAQWAVASQVVPLAVLYNVIAGPCVVWLVLRLIRRVDGRRARAGLDPVPGFHRAR